MGEYESVNTRVGQRTVRTRQMWVRDDRCGGAVWTGMTGAKVSVYVMEVTDGTEGTWI